MQRITFADHDDDDERTRMRDAKAAKVPLPAHSTSDRVSR